MAFTKSMLYSVHCKTNIFLLNKFELHVEEGDRFRIEFLLNGGSESVISALKILQVNIKTVRYSSADTQALLRGKLASKRFP
jgi:hypothetical protein